MAVQNDRTVVANVASVTKIPGYKIKGVLGRGGMAVVYLAEQESIGREVALKVLVPDHADETFSQRFLTEARIISQLSHPNIVTVYDAGVHQGNHYMAMEYIKGKTLGEAREEMSLSQRVDVIKQMADALEYAGSKGYVHRDIKPENIMCHEGGRAVLMDFGIARSLDTTKGLTVTGKAIGTPYYMSPEQTKGLKVDPRSDIYSLGVVLFQMLAGRVPYDGPSFVAVGIKHISEPIPVLPPGFEAFQQIINNSMSKEPGHRYQKAAELKQALEALPDSVYEKQTARQPMASTQVHSARTVVETAAAPATPQTAAKAISKSQPISSQAGRDQVPSFRPTRQHRTLPPIDITDSDDFKRIGRRRRLLYLLLLSTLALGAYHRQDLWMSSWQYEVAPWIATHVPNSQRVLKYLPPAKERPQVKADQVVVKPPIKNLAPATEPAVSIVVQPEVTEQQARLDTQNDVAAINQKVEAGKTVGVTQPLTPEQERTEKIKTLVAGLDEHSENALKLVILYKSVLVHDRDNATAKQGLVDLEIWFGKNIRQAINEEQWETARLLLNMLKESFPLAMQADHFKFMQHQIQTAEKLKTYLQKAEHYLQLNRRLNPPGGNALEEYNKALSIVPDSAEVKDGIQKIADYFYQQARQQQKAKDIQAAINSTNAGLQAVKDHRHLLALRDELKYSMKHQQNVRNLLASAKSQLASGNLITPRGKSGYDLYQVVLAESPGNPAAVKGLETIERKLVQHIRRLIKQEQYQKAHQNLQTAQQYFRNSRALDFLQRKLTSETYQLPTTSN